MAGRGRRQQSGFACQECRRRKARCDRGRPSCGFCVETGNVCVIIDRQAQRGLRKGQISAMRSQIASLQWQLNKQLGFDTDRSQSPSLGQITPDLEYDVDSLQGIADLEDLETFDQAGVGPSIQTVVDPSMLRRSPSPTSMLGGTTAAPAPSPSSSINWLGRMIDPKQSDDDPMLSMDMDLLKALPPLPSPPATTTWKALSLDSSAGQISPLNLDSSAGQTSLVLTESDGQQVAPPNGISPVMTEHERADLDQVFFDRVHPVLPFIHRRRCHGWIDQPSPGMSRACLRSAMRTIAAAMSTLGARFCDQLYADTRRLLDGYTVTTKESIELEYIQVWLLLGFYELLRVGENQAMLTAARCSRLVLMARLFEIDAPTSNEATGPQLSPVSLQQESHEEDGFSVVEERRRTFWLAYCLDCFLCSRNEYPPTMQEETICTRLPAPEVNFQNNQSVRSPFLAEALSGKPTKGASPPLSSFAECVVLATLYAQSSNHRRTQITGPPDTPRGDFWARVKYLAAAVETRVQDLAAHPTHVDSDPMLLLAHMLAQGAVIKLGQASTSSPAWGPAEHDQQQQYKRRAWGAVSEMVWLTRQAGHFRCFKVHPFLPDPLACAISFFNSGGGAPAGTIADAGGVAHLVRVLKDMQGMNSLAWGNFYSLGLDSTQLLDSAQL